jgi:hypothetical protein
MRRLPVFPILAAALLFAGALPLAQAQPAREWRGVTEGGANAYIRVPAGWQPGAPLAIVNHGYSLDFDDSPSLGPLVDVILADGVAVAASGYRTRGWAPFVALDDNQRLLEAFTAQFGAPGPLYAVGGSMGGLISLKQAEDPRFAARTVGVYALCPPAAGARAWDSGFDLRMAYDAVCAGVGGGELIRGDAPLAWAMNLADIPEELSVTGRSDPAVRTLARINQCTGLNLPPALRTPPQRDRLRRITELSRIPSEDFLLVNLGYSTFALGELTRAPDKLGARSAFDNRAVAYGGDSGFEASVFRQAADPWAAIALRQSSNVNGAASARILSLHTDGDLLVLPQHQQVLRLKYPNGNLVQAEVRETVDSHCGFNRAELVAGWRALREWTAGGVKPTTAALQQRCEAVQTGGEPGPCRIAALPAYDLDSAIRPRAPEPPNTIDGLWFDPARDGEGVVVESIGDPLGYRQRGPQRVVVSWFTYPPNGAPGGQRWLVGVGEVYDNAIVVREMTETRDGRFAGAPGSPAAIKQAWGRVDLWFDRDDDGRLASLRLRYAGPPQWGSGELRLQQLTGLGTSRNVPGTHPASLAENRAAQRAGWYIVPQDGEGMLMQQQLHGDGSATSLVVWYTYDLAGLPMFLVGATRAPLNAAACDAPIDIDVSVTRGARFGAAFDPAQVQVLPWGRVRLDSRNCALTTLRWTANDPAYGSGELPLFRLTAPLGVR